MKIILNFEKTQVTLAELRRIFVLQWESVRKIMQKHKSFNLGYHKKINPGKSCMQNVHFLKLRLFNVRKYNSDF